MPNCHVIDPLVTPFVDGELAEGERRLVEDHLRACPPCHSRVAAERAVHQLIRARVTVLCAAAPQPLRARCQQLAARAAAAAVEADRATDAASAQPGGAARPRVAPRASSFAPGSSVPSSWLGRLTPYALAASLVLVVGGAFVYQATDSSAHVLAAELTADHMKCFAMNAALGTQQLPAAVETSMQLSFDWRMHLPETPERAGLELVGSRPCLYGEGKVAHIMYRHEGRPVSLFMLPNSSRAAQLVKVFGHEAAIWCAGNRTFVLLAKEPRPEVERMASFVQASMH
jgi:anti-sigma factor RsiW